MKKIVCFGAGEKSKRIKALIEDAHEAEVVGFVEDSAFFKIGMSIDGVEVISIYNMAKKYKRNEIDGVVISSAYHKRTVQEMIMACEAQNIDENDIYLVNHNKIAGAKDETKVLTPRNEFVQIYDICVHLTDHCNMNCELCAHFSQFATEIPGGYITVSI